MAYNPDNPHNNPRIDTLQANQFDWALLQGWVDDFYKVTGVYPVGKFVWSYATKNIFGEPFPLDEEADKLLEQYNNRNKI